MANVATTARFEIGRVISRLFGVLGRNFVSFLILAALLVGAPTAALGFVQLSYFAGLAGPAGSPFAPFATGIGAWLITTIANAVMQGAVIHGTVSDLAGRPASLGDCLATGMRFILPLIGIGFISAIGIGVGLLFFIVPGVLIWLAWSVAASAEVMERPGVFGAMSRSAELTRNHRGAIFGLMVIYFVVVIFVQMIVRAIVGGVGGLPMATFEGANARSLLVSQTLTTFVVQTATVLVGSVGIASVYYELRTIKDGVGAEQLAAVFD